MLLASQDNNHLSNLEYGLPYFKLSLGNRHYDPSGRMEYLDTVKVIIMLPVMIKYKENLYTISEIAIDYSIVKSIEAPIAYGNGTFEKSIEQHRDYYIKQSNLSL